MSAPPFSRLLADHADALFRFCVASVGRQDAEDCFQEAVAAALGAYPPRRQDNVKSWLFTIAHHKAIDHHRAGARRAVPMAALPEQPAGRGLDDTDGELWDAVRQLPAKQRDAVLFRFAADLPYGAVGELIGCSEAAARQNVRAALGNLREVVER